MLPILLACAHAAETPMVEWGPDGHARVARTGAPRPGSEELAWIEGEEILFGAPGAVTRRLPLPSLLPAESNHRVAWYDAGRLYLQANLAPTAPEYNDLVGPDTACALIDVGTGAWTHPKACVTGDFLAIYALHFEAGLVVVHSAGEGHPGVLVAPWSPEAGQGEPVTPDLDLYPFGPAEVWLRGGRVELTTPCRLGQPRPCDAEDVEGRAWGHYVVTDGKFVLLQDGLPAWAVPHPQNARWAWGEPGRVCEGNPSGRHRCKRVPAEKAAGAAGAAAL